MGLADHLDYDKNSGRPCSAAIAIDQLDDDLRAEFEEWVETREPFSIEEMSAILKSATVRGTSEGVLSKHLRGMCICVTG